MTPVPLVPFTSEAEDAMDNTTFQKMLKKLGVKPPADEQVSFICNALEQGCDCAANQLMQANSDPNFIISEISVNQVRKCFPAWWVGGLCYSGTAVKMLRLQELSVHLAFFAPGQSHPGRVNQ